MKSNNLFKANQNSKLALKKAKNLLRITQDILEKRYISYDQNKIIEFSDNIKAWVDQETNLMWEIKQEANVQIIYTLVEAMEYVENLNENKYCGYDDWRIPIKLKADTILGKNTFYKLPLNKNFDSEAPTWYFLTKTVYENYNDNLVWFYGGCEGGEYDWNTQKAQLRCVRGTMTKIPIFNGHLDISGSNLTTIPFNLIETSKISSLDIRGNNIKNLSNNKLLNILNLYFQYNQLLNIPDDLFNMTDLEYLDLSHNSIVILSSRISLLVKIKTLNLSFNNIQITPVEIGNLNNLESLDLSRNNLTNISSEISKCSNLKNISLSFNLLKNIPKEIANLKCLKSIYLGDNDLRYLPDSIVKLTNLESLFIHNNPNLIVTEEQKEWILSLKYKNYDDDLFNRALFMIEVNDDEIPF